MTVDQYPVIAPPSDWLVRHAKEIRPGGSVLDVACGSGRNANWLAANGFTVHGVDRDPAPRLAPEVFFVQADIEAGHWPYVGRHFDAVIVANYLHRPLFGAILDAIVPGGVLIYETFAAGNERFGRPSRPEFLLQPGELLDCVREKMTVICYEHGYVPQPRPAIMQRLVARR